MGMATDVEQIIQRVMQGHSRGDLYAVVGVAPLIGDSDVHPDDRMRAFMVVRSIELAATNSSTVDFFVGG